MLQRVIAVLVILALVLLLLRVLYHGIGNDANSRLIRELTTNERAALGLNSTNYIKTNFVASNPWRSKRFGCGGRVRRSARRNVRVSLRYAQWSSSGSLQDSDAADLILGDTHPRLTRALTGLCAGDIAKLDQSLFAITHVGEPNSIGDTYAAADTLAANVIATPGTRRHLSCTAVCRRKGLRCEEHGFVVVNDCDRLRTAFDCVGCEVAPAGAAGADMPCMVNANAPRPFRSRLCLVAPHPKHSRCVASHMHTVRLCPCVT